VKFLADAAKRGGNGLRFNYLRNTLAHKVLGLPRSQRLTSGTDLELVRRTGKRMKTECLEARVSASLLRYPRVGVVVPKHGRNITDRNRVKRQLRELARVRLVPAVGSVDLLLRAEPGAYSARFDELARQVDAIADWISQATARN
jgi:ribonuclease P protein component